MASIDSLFRKPNAPPKRKLEDPNVSFRSNQQQSANKAVKVTNGSTPHGNIDAVRHASVQDEELDAEDSDVEAGPELPPEDDAAPDEDDEGRFFGGGVSKQERDVLDYIERNEEAETEEKIDLSWLKRTAINFERAINKNAELRAKYLDDPMKFVGSEADLDAEIKHLGVLSDHADLYKDFAKLGCVGSLVGLLAHENTDIAVSVCELLEELTDEDTAAQPDQWKTLIDAMVKADVIALLTSNLSRLDEAIDTDRAGIYHVLSVVENLLSEPDTSEMFGANAPLLTWLKERIRSTDADARAKVGQNRQYAAEILAILLQTNEQNRKRFVRIDGVDVLLQLLSAYRKRDPEKDSDEAEFVENLFDCLVAVAKDSDGAVRFLDGEGIELCLIMLREGKLSKARAMRVLDHALGGQQAGIVGERLVEAAGLKTIFSIFMKSEKQDRETIEHMIGIFASLLRYLPPQSAARIRILAKFVEKDYEKAVRLVTLRGDYAARTQLVDKQIDKEKQGLSAEELEDLEPEWLSRRFDAGLFSLQTLDVVLAWLVAEDDGARTKVLDLLQSNGSDGISTLKASLTEQLASTDIEDGKDTREMLEALMRCLT